MPDNPLPDIYRTPPDVLLYVLQHTATVLDPAPGSAAFLLHAYRVLHEPLDVVAANPPYSAARSLQR